MHFNSWKHMDDMRNTDCERGGMTMAELKCCPFCGYENPELQHDHNYGGYSYITCPKCKCISEKFPKLYSESSDKRAIEAWNRRADNG